MKTKSKTTAKKRTVSEAAANLRAAKAKGKKRSKSAAKSKKAASANARTGVKPGSKLEIVAGLLTRADGCTGAEILAATGWPTVSVPQQAKAAGLKLSKEKIDGITRYRGVAEAKAAE